MDERLEGTTSMAASNIPDMGQHDE